MSQPTTRATLSATCSPRWKSPSQARRANTVTSHRWPSSDLIDVSVSPRSSWIKHRSPWSSALMHNMWVFMCVRAIVRRSTCTPTRWSLKCSRLSRNTMPMARMPTRCDEIWLNWAERFTVIAVLKPSPMPNRRQKSTIIIKLMDIVVRGRWMHSESKIRMKCACGQADLGLKVKSCIFHYSEILLNLRTFFCWIFNKTKPITITSKSFSKIKDRMWVEFYVSYLVVFQLQYTDGRTKRFLRTSPSFPTRLASEVVAVSKQVSVNF